MYENNESKQKIHNETHLSHIREIILKSNRSISIEIFFGYYVWKSNIASSDTHSSTYINIRRRYKPYYKSDSCAISKKEKPINVK